MNGAEAAKDAHLFHIAYDGGDAETLQLRVDGVQASHKVAQEEFKGLRQADELTSIHLK